MSTHTAHLGLFHARRHGFVARAVVVTGTGRRALPLAAGITVIRRRGRRDGCMCGLDQVAVGVGLQRLLGLIEATWGWWSA